MSRREMDAVVSFKKTFYNNEKLSLEQVRDGFMGNKIVRKPFVLNTIYSFLNSHLPHERYTASVLDMNLKKEETSPFLMGLHFSGQTNMTIGL